MGKKLYYYSRFLGEVVGISEYKYDEKKHIVHYKDYDTGDWETDLTPCEDPMFFESKTECVTVNRDILSNELDKYQERQDAILKTLTDAITTAYNELDIISWEKVRTELNDKLPTLSLMLYAKSS